MTPISSTTNIVDLIVAIPCLGSKKLYEYWVWCSDDAITLDSEMTD